MIDVYELDKRINNANKVIELTRFNVRMIIFKYNYRKLMPKMLLILMWALLNQ